ncbi:MAG: hypothetical protein NZ561_08540, partial [Phycisphaerae bacterium]|nr:hypothetical protein [Phycisphaerae bacterium]MDW8263375.1 hypothetical protein [Phycisphaerales bacterium]
SLRGAASAVGASLGGGILDATVDARLQDGGDVEVRSRLVLTDLQLSEPANGPIVRYLKLGAPLDVVIDAVQDVDGSITLPLNLKLPKGQLQPGEVLGSAVGAISQVLLTAVANAPLKAAAGVGGLLGAEKGARAEPQTVAIAFAAGDASLDEGARESLSELVRQLRRDRNLQLTLRHELSRRDLDLVDARANPAPEDLLALTARLRQRKEESLRQREPLAAAVRGKVATLSPAEATAALAELREIDRQAGFLELSLDHVLDQMKPGADRQRPRRTRAAALELARERLENTREFLTSAGLADLAERVRAAPPSFAVGDSTDGGRVMITLIEKKT